MKTLFSIMLPQLLMALVLCLLLFTTASAQGGEKEENQLNPTLPHFVLQLNFNEFSVLTGALVSGLNRYGGEIECVFKISKTENEISWTLSIQNPRAVEALNHWLAEKSADLIRFINVDELDANSIAALRTMKSLQEKVAQAQANPVWDLFRVTGVVDENEGKWFLDGLQGRYQITGNQLAELQKLKGKTLVTHGFIKAKGQIEVIRFLEKKENTLELFVMSLCPYGQKAEVSLLQFLKEYPGKTKPALDIRYIFYKTNQNGKADFTALRGEKEVQENVVQMLIRDRHPQFFHRYLLKRLDNPCSWEKLSKEIGMGEDAIQSIRYALEKEKEALIEKEYAYVTELHQIYDGSPTYLWESERVVDIRTAEAFKDLTFFLASAENCSN